MGTKLRMASPSPCLAAESSCSIMVPNLSRARPLATDRSELTGPMLFLALVVGIPPQVTMRDLPGFVWDEERQRYFALQSEPVARSLQQ